MPKNKGKRRATEHEVSQQIAAPSPSTGFHLVAVDVELPIPAQFHSDLQAGAREILDHWISRYIPSLGVILCTVSRPFQFPHATAHFIGKTGVVLTKVRFEGLGWRPVVGSRLVGKINSSSNAHVGLLLHNTFNATIEHISIPADRYVYDDNRTAPFMAADHREQAPVNGGDVEDDNGVSAYAEEVFDYGCWVDSATNEPLGGADGKLEFVVIGLTISSGIMTVMGSLLDDPLNPPPRNDAAAVEPPMPASQINGTADALRAPTSSQKVVHFTPDTTSLPARKVKKRKDRPPEGIVTEVETISVNGTHRSDADLPDPGSSIEEQRPKKKKKKRKYKDTET